ncbi:hypothetical protein PMAYCL1PPCAC_30554 [Pristionchus mayeri]|uniref:Dehydrogenase n=1 Tax=Pristionchus mayeri TaxID=1317129 RepID=A0AAN5ID98_9BILA|nr:hypothetical protein PMAYCL1PPCAC_30554 [Pristionchus mayeri]
METCMAWIGSGVSLFVAFSFLSFLFRRIFLERSYLPQAGKVVVVTGCDSGFGWDTAIRLVKGGSTVIAGCFLEKSLTALKEAVGPSLADQIITLRLNLEDDESTDAFVRDIRSYLDDHDLSLHAFVNNAGLFAAGPTEWMSRAHIRRLFQVNTVGAMELTNRVAPLLAEGGRLVSISSVSAVVHGPLLALYGASKAALDNFHSALRVETERPFSVHLIMPGSFKTPLLNPTALRANITAGWNNAPESVRQDFGSRYFETFTSNWTEGVVHYASNRPSWVTDNVLHAIFAAHPRARYYTGYDAIFLFSILSFAPTWIQDAFHRRVNRRFFQSPEGEKVSMACFEKPLASKPKAA